MEDNIDKFRVIGFVFAVLGFLVRYSYRFMCIRNS